MSLAARVFVGVAILKLAWMMAALVFGAPAPDAPAEGMAFGEVPTALLALAFGGVGAFLIWASPALDRAWWLGATLLLTAAPFGDAVLRRRELTGLEGAVVPALAVDTFLPFALWSFLRLFPRTPDPARDLVASGVAHAAAVVGAVLAAANLIAHAAPPGLAGPLALFTLQRSGVVYVVGVIGATALGLPYLWWKAQRARGSESQRVRLFTAALVAGCGPLLLDIVLSALSPAYDAWAWRPDVMALRMPALFLALALFPLLTAYSVLVDRVVDLRVALRAAAQYALARYTLLTLVSVPFVLLVAYLYEHRDERLGALLGGPRVILLGGLISLGAAALNQRHRWLRAIDRRFFRDETDSTGLVTTLSDHARASATLEELTAFVRGDVADALHAEHAVLLVADPTRTALVDPEGRIRSLSQSSGLAMLLLGDAAPFEVAGPAAANVVARLSVQERRWLTDGGFQILAPLRRSPSSLAAVLALGPKRGGLPYTRTDLRGLAMVAATVGLALENQRLKSSPSGDDEEPADECLSCGVVFASGSESCRCGGSVAHAPVPRTLRGAFTFEQRLGAGGMGVVYRALDLSLNRLVAIKTLPRLSPSRADRLRDEARTMARLAHPHLATIHGVETWRGVPLLVVELLTGGTLADRLKSGPLPMSAVMEMAFSLTDVLHHIHDAAMVHRDIKPSNIGFTGSGTLKLLDFGLAQIFSGEDGPLDTGTVVALDTDTTHTAGNGGSRRLTGRFAGTPLYMSPEALDAARVAPGFDLWSTAVVLYEAAAGHHPFAGGTTEQVLGRIRRGECVGVDALRTRCPAKFVDTLEACLSPDPQRRPDTARALRARLHAVRIAEAPAT